MMGAVCGQKLSASALRPAKGSVSIGVRVPMLLQSRSHVKPQDAPLRPTENNRWVHPFLRAAPNEDSFAQSRARVRPQVEDLLCAEAGDPEITGIYDHE